MKDFGTSGTVDAADVPLAGVRAFLDLDYDYLYDAGEPTALTNAAGIFTIAGLEYRQSTGFQNYLVIENPSGTRQTAPYTTNPYVTVYNSTDVGTYLFAAPVGATAVGHLYKDLNTNGVRDPDEPGIAYQQIGTHFTSQDLDAVVTDREGLYVYKNSWNGGSYSLSAKMPTAWIATDPASGGGKSVSIPPNTVVAGPDFGYVDF